MARAGKTKTEYGGKNTHFFLDYYITYVLAGELGSKLHHLNDLIFSPPKNPPPTKKKRKKREEALSHLFGL